MRHTLQALRYDGEAKISKTISNFYGFVKNIRGRIHITSISDDGEHATTRVLAEHEIDVLKAADKANRKDLGEVFG